MSRIRTIKPSLWTSQTLARCSRGARLLFIGLVTEADDDGRMADSPKRLAGALFPFDDDVDAACINGWLGELETVGAVVRYEADGGGRFLALPGFRAHQKVDHPRPSTLPPPPPNLSRTSREPLAKPSREPPQPSRENFGEDRIGSEGIGSEGIGGDRTRARAPSPALPPPPKNALVEDPTIENIPAPLPGRLRGARTMGRGVVGMVEGENAPPDPAGWVEQHPEIRDAYPALDGRDGRLRLVDVVASKWTYWLRRHAEHGRADADANMRTWLSDAHAKAKRDYAGDAITKARDPSRQVVPPSEPKEPEDAKAEHARRLEQVRALRTQVAAELGAQAPPDESDREAFGAWWASNGAVVREAARRMKEQRR